MSSLAREREKPLSLTDPDLVTLHTLLFHFLILFLLVHHLETHTLSPLRLFPSIVFINIHCTCVTFVNSNDGLITSLEMNKF